MNTDSNASQMLQPPKQSLRRYWILSAVFMALAVAVIPFDLVLAKPGNLQYFRGDVRRFITLSELFAHGFGIAIVGIGIWLLAEQKRRLIPRILTCAFWPSIIVHVLKACFGRFRPLKYMDESSQGVFPTSISETWLGWLPDGKLNFAFASQSFPSGHTATTWGLAIGMSWAFPKGRWLYFTIAVMASVQRVASLAHWPSDVFCSAAIAVVAAAAITQNWGLGYYLGRFENQTKASRPFLASDPKPTIVEKPKPHEPD